MSKNIDLRILKTKKLIHDSFIELIDEKGFDKITINEIAERAQINRSTFYLHYADKYEWLNETVDYAVNKILALISPKSHVKDGHLEIESFHKDIKNILDIISSEALLYKLILKEKIVPDAYEKLIHIFKQSFENAFPEETLIPKELFISLLLSLYIETINWWLDSNMMYSSNYMSEQIIKLLTLGPITVSGLIYR